MLIGMSLALSQARRSGVSAGGGAEVQIPWDSTSIHSDAWVWDDFNYANTAAWLAAIRAKPNYILEAEGRIEEFSIDTGSTFNGHPTLLTSPVVPGAPYIAFSAPELSQIQWSRTGSRFGASLPSTIDVVGFVDDYDTYLLDGGPHYDSNDEEWSDLSNGDIMGAQAASELVSSDPIFVQKCERIAPASFALTLWVNGVKIAPTSTHAAYDPFAGLGMAYLIAANNGGQRYTFFEAVSGDGLTLPPYTGLEA